MEATLVLCHCYIVIILLLSMFCSYDFSQLCTIILIITLVFVLTPDILVCLYCLFTKPSLIKCLLDRLCFSLHFYFVCWKLHCHWLFVFKLSFITNFIFTYVTILLWQFITLFILLVSLKLIPYLLFVNTIYWVLVSLWGFCFPLIFSIFLHFLLVSTPFYFCR